MVVTVLNTGEEILNSSLSRKSVLFFFKFLLTWTFDGTLPINSVSKRRPKRLERGSEHHYGHEQ